MKNLLKSKGLPRPRRKIDIGIIALLVMGGYFLVYKPVVTWQDKQRFKEAEKAIEQLYTEIESKVGKLDQVLRDNTCGRANLKNAKGPLVCNVAISMLFANSNLETSRDLMKKISGLNSNDIRRGSGSSRGNEFYPLQERSEDQVFYQDISDTGNLPCVISYRYPVIKDNNDSISPVPEENLQVVLSCGGPAKAEHYPTKN